jgi:hypothetical protein
MTIFKMITNGSYVNIKVKLEPARQVSLKRRIYHTGGMVTTRVAMLALKMTKIGQI